MSLDVGDVGFELLDLSVFGGDGFVGLAELGGGDGVVADALDLILGV